MKIAASISFDARADVLYIIFHDAPGVAVEIELGVFVRMDNNKHVVGITLMDFLEKSGGVL